MFGIAVSGIQGRSMRSTGDVGEMELVFMIFVHGVGGVVSTRIDIARVDTPVIV